MRFCQVKNLKSITFFNSITNAMGLMEMPLTDRKVGCYDGLGHPLKIWAASNIGQNLKKKKKKKGARNFTTTYSIPFVSALHQNKALHNFHKGGSPRLLDA